MSNLEWTLAAFCAALVCALGAVGHYHRQFRAVMNARLEQVLKQYRDLLQQVERGTWRR